MATRIEYTPPVPDHDAAQEQAEDLVEALHETGLLRALTGAVRAYPELAEMLVTRLDAERLRGLFELGGLVGVLSPDGARSFVDGARSALAAADHAAHSDPPSLLGLARQLSDPDVRRGAAALVAALGALGASLAGDDRGGRGR